MAEIKKPQYLTDIIDDFDYYSACLRDANDKAEIPSILQGHIQNLCSGSPEVLEGFAVRSFDRLYRRLMQVTSFDQYARAYFELVIADLWKVLADRGIRMFYILDNSLREDRFKLTCEAFSLSGIAVVTPYSRNFQDGSDDLFDVFDRERMKARKPSTAFKVGDHLIYKMVGYCPEGHHLEANEVEALIGHYMKSGKMVAYIEKDSSVNYLDRVMQIGKADGYIQIFRNKASDDGEFGVSGKNFKDKVTIVIDAKAP